jgi:hypothetical protein
MASVPNPISAVEPNSKVAYVFTDVGQLHVAIQNGWIPIHPDGTPFKVQSFEGGYLLDGAPINVWMGLGWYSGQIEALQPYWANGQVPTPPASISGAPVVPMPADVAANFQAYQQRQQNILGLPWWAWAAGAAAYLLL